MWKASRGVCFRLKPPSPKILLQMNRPASAQIEVPGSYRLGNHRPLSDQFALYKSPEAKVIDKWFEDLSYYEKTLDEMAQVNLDDGFTEELKCVENWFRVLSDGERTACLYLLLKGTTPIQIRFFTTVLQQMAAKDSNFDRVSAISFSHGNHILQASTSTRTSSKLDDLRLSSRSSNSRLSQDFAARVRSMVTAQEDADELLSSSDRSSMASPLKSDWNLQSGQRTSSLQISHQEFKKALSFNPTTTYDGPPPNLTKQAISPTSPNVVNLPKPQAANNNDDFVDSNTKQTDFIDTNLIKGLVY